MYHVIVRIRYPLGAPNQYVQMKRADIYRLFIVRNTHEPYYFLAINISLGKFRCVFTFPVELRYIG